MGIYIELYTIGIGVYIRVYAIGIGVCTRLFRSYLFAMGVYRGLSGLLQGSIGVS